MSRRGWVCFGLAALLACEEGPPPAPPSGAPEVAPGPVAMRRLTHGQYVASVLDVLGGDLEVPTRLEPDQVPLLDVFLDPNGVALAQDGTPLPLRFGTWFWGCGMNPDRWIPQRDGADYDLPPELAPLEAVREHVSVLSGFDVILDGTPNTPHVSGVVGHLTGTAPAGANVAHHQLTHDEPLDAELGYQPRATEFVLESMTAWASLVSTLNAIPEGDGTLLDRCLVVGHSETSFAKIHDVTRLPVMFAGRAGGRIRPGLHVRGRGEPVTRLALTAQQVMGRSIERFGTGSMEVDRGVSEVLA